MEFPPQKPQGSQADRALGMDAEMARADFLDGRPFAGPAGAPAMMAKEDWDGYGGVGDYASSNGNTLEVIADAHRMIRDHAFEHLPESVIDTFVYGVNDLGQIVGYWLQMRNATVAVAESCTGGLLSERLTSISGSSRYFLGGAVVYSNALKTELAGVPTEMIDRHGAVSREVAARCFCDPRTVRAYLNGRPQHSTTAARIERALRELRADAGKAPPEGAS